MEGRIRFRSKIIESCQYCVNSSRLKDEQENGFCKMSVLACLVLSDLMYEAENSRILHGEKTPMKFQFLTDHLDELNGLLNEAHPNSLEQAARVLAYLNLVLFAQIVRRRQLLNSKAQEVENGAMSVSEEAPSSTNVLECQDEIIAAKMDQCQVNYRFCAKTSELTGANAFVKTSALACRIFFDLSDEDNMRQFDLCNIATLSQLLLDCKWGSAEQEAQVRAYQCLAAFAELWRLQLSSEVRKDEMPTEEASTSVTTEYFDKNNCDEHVTTNQSTPTVETSSVSEDRFEDTAEGEEGTMTNRTTEKKTLENVARQSPGRDTTLPEWFLKTSQNLPEMLEKNEMQSLVEREDYATMRYEFDPLTAEDECYICGENCMALLMNVHLEVDHDSVKWALYGCIDCNFWTTKMSEGCFHAIQKGCIFRIRSVQDVIDAQLRSETGVSEPPAKKRRIEIHDNSEDASPFIAINNNDMDTQSGIDNPVGARIGATLPEITKAFALRENKKRLLCPYCSIECTRGFLEDHMLRIHDHANASVFGCSKCNDWYSTLAAAVDHWRRNGCIVCVLTSREVVNDDVSKIVNRSDEDHSSNSIEGSGGIADDVSAFDSQSQYSPLECQNSTVSVIENAENNFEIRSGASPQSPAKKQPAEVEEPLGNTERPSSSMASSTPSLSSASITAAIDKNTRKLLLLHEIAEAFDHSGKNTKMRCPYCNVLCSKIFLENHMIKLHDHANAPLFGCRKCKIWYSTIAEAVDHWRRHGCTVCVRYLPPIVKKYLSKIVERSDDKAQPQPLTEKQLDMIEETIAKNPSSSIAASQQSIIHRTETATFIRRVKSMGVTGPEISAAFDLEGRKSRMGCSYCSRAFTRDDLEQHMIDAHDHKDATVFGCRGCKTWFKTMSDAVYHWRTQGCTVCVRTFEEVVNDDVSKILDICDKDRSSSPIEDLEKRDDDAGQSEQIASTFDLREESSPLECLNSTESVNENEESSTQIQSITSPQTSGENSEAASEGSRQSQEIASTFDSRGQSNSLECQNSIESIKETVETANQIQSPPTSEEHSGAASEDSSLSQRIVSTVDSLGPSSVLVSQNDTVSRIENTDTNSEIRSVASPQPSVEKQVDVVEETLDKAERPSSSMASSKPSMNRGTGSVVIIYKGRQLDGKMSQAFGRPGRSTKMGCPYCHVLCSKIYLENHMIKVHHHKNEPLFGCRKCKNWYCTIAEAIDHWSKHGCRVCVRSLPPNVKKNLSKIVRRSDDKECESNKLGDFGGISDDTRQKMVATQSEIALRQPPTENQLELVQRTIDQVPSSSISSSQPSTIYRPRTTSRGRRAKGMGGTGHEISVAFALTGRKTRMRCSYCSCLFSRGVLEQHMIDDHDHKDATVFGCRGCKKWYNAMSDAVDHWRKQGCTICVRTFQEFEDDDLSKIAEISMHIDREAERTEASREMSDEDQINQQMIAAFDLRGPSTTLECPYCAISCEVGNIEDHMISVHDHAYSALPLFGCRKCKVWYASMEEVMKHWKSLASHFRVAFCGRFTLSIRSVKEFEQDPEGIVILNEQVDNSNVHEQQAENGHMSEEMQEMDKTTSDQIDCMEGITEVHVVNQDQNVLLHEGDHETGPTILEETSTSETLENLKDENLNEHVQEEEAKTIEQISTKENVDNNEGITKASDDQADNDHMNEVRHDAAVSIVEETSTSETFEGLIGTTEPVEAVQAENGHEGAQEETLTTSEETLSLEISLNDPEITEAVESTQDASSHLYVQVVVNGEEDAAVPASEDEGQEEELIELEATDEEVAILMAVPDDDDQATEEESQGMSLLKVHTGQQASIPV